MPVTEMERSEIEVCTANISEYRVPQGTLCPNVRLPRNRKVSGVFLLCRNKK